MALARSLLASALALVCAPAMADAPFSQTVFFGDSLSDAGTFRPTLVQIAGPSAALLGKFTANPGLIWAEYLADNLGTGAQAANQGGTNHAVGGARAGVDSTLTLAPGVTVTAPSLATQVDAYLAATGGRADARALYTVWGGANDVFAAVTTANAGGDPAPVISAAVTAQIGAVSALQAAGARYVMVPTLPDIGLTPGFRAQGAAAQAAGTQLSGAYNAALYSGLAAAGVRFIPLDTYHLLQEMIANPAAFGIANTTGTACQPQITAQSLTCNPGTWVGPDAASTYAFADGVHPTPATHAILADYALSMLEAPQFGAVLVNSAVANGRARAERISAQTEHRPDTEGMRTWLDLRGNYQRHEHGDLYDGGTPALSLGADWRSGDLVFGGFLGYGRGDFDFGGRRGSFEQDEASIGAYLGWRSGGGWASVQASYTRIGYEVERRVQLGPGARLHRGEPDGRNLSLGALGGWEFGEGMLRHGPVIGLLAQRIDVDAWAEDQAALSTSLAYPEQEFDSLIGSLGWQFSVQAGDHFAPYVRATFDREFEDHPEEAYARAQSLPGSAPYAVPGLRFNDRYGTVLLGARTHLLGFDANVGASLTVGHGDGGDITVFATLGLPF